MPHPFSRYRLRLFGDFVRIVLGPSLIFAAIRSVTNAKLGLLAVPAWLFSLLVASYARVQYRDYKRRITARQMGARLPVEVVGRWPGNIDILIEVGRAARSRYPSTFYHDLFEKYQTTTLNLKLLWSDLVRISLSFRISSMNPNDIY
jgi:hypothetical protein